MEQLFVYEGTDKQRRYHGYVLPYSMLFSARASEVKGVHTLD